MLSKDAKKYLSDIKKNPKKRQSVFSKIENDIMGLYDENLTYDEIWDYAKTQIEDMPTSKNSLVNFIQVRVKKRKQSITNSESMANTNSESMANKNIQKNNQKTIVINEEDKKKKHKQEVKSESKNDYSDFEKLAKERIKIQNN